MNDDEFDELIDSKIDEMISDGSLILGGLEDDGEPYYNMNPELMKELHPEFYESMMSELDDTLMNLYMDGLIDVEYDENLTPIFSVSDKGLEYIESILEGEDGYS